MKSKFIYGPDRDQVEGAIDDFLEEEKIKPDEIVSICFGKYANIYEVLIIYTAS